MSRIKDIFQNKQQRVLNVYCTAGYPTLDSTVNIINTLAANGADLIELGMPYSDPLADGPVIQASNGIALANGRSTAVLSTSAGLGLRVATSVEVSATDVDVRDNVATLAFGGGIGIDNRGCFTGTRVRVVDAQGRLLGRGSAGPSGLSQGVEQAWRHVGQAVQAAFADAGLALPPPPECAMALALAGAERSSKLDRKSVV